MTKPWEVQLNTNVLMLKVRLMKIFNNSLEQIGDSALEPDQLKQVMDSGSRMLKLVSDKMLELDPAETEKSLDELTKIIDGVKK